MDKIISDLTFTTVLILTTAGSAIVYFIKNGSELIFNYLKKELEFRQKIKNTKRELELKEYKIKVSKKIENLEKEINTIEENKMVLNNGITLMKHLREIREFVNARNVTLAVYHNGNSKGFRNWSIRFEDSRALIYSILQSFQTKPLSEYYPFIKGFEKQKVYFVKPDDKITDENQGSVLFLKLHNLKSFFSVPLLVPVDLVSKADNVMTISRNSEDYAILGTVNIITDEESIDKNFEELESFFVRKVDDILNLYEKDHYLFT